ncbi:MAG: PilN domain-containing protein [Candidatus Omnitrophica bacterium]|nr:PilN domain-containing protein [Candidatus Omnitrophota bacterium]
MIELNLLPKELRKKKKQDLPEIPILPVAVLCVIMVVVTHVSLCVFVKGRNVQAVRLKEKWEELQPQKKITDRVLKDIQYLEKRMKATETIVTPDLDWVELLSGLNQAMTDHVWLSGFNPVFERSRGKAGKKTGLPVTLTLTGYALGKSDIATFNVAKFINSLKLYEDFLKYFEEIELQNIRKEMLDGEEVMRFTLICRFKKAVGPVKEKKTAGRR